MAKVTITLIVQAESLYKLSAPEPPAINNKCRLKDNKKESPPDSPLGSFETDVYIDQDVKWEGATNDPNGVDKGYSVEIDNIVYVPTGNDKDFFNRNIVCGKNGNVLVKVKNDPNLVNQIDTYTINFSIVHPQGSQGVPKYYKIDPIIRGNP
ncbi:MAG: hypothetical protein WBM53_15610 [Maribacter sp.]